MFPASAVRPVEGPHVDSVRRPERPLANVDDDAPHRAHKCINRSQPWQHASVIAWPGPDLDRHELIATPKQEVHFCPVSGMRCPVVQVLEQSPLLPVDPQQMQDPAFKECATPVGRNRSMEFLHRPYQARIGPVELWMLGFTTLRQSERGRQTLR